MSRLRTLDECGAALGMIDSGGLQGGAVFEEWEINVP